MKKLFLLLICSAFTILSNAQSFIVVNNTNAPGPRVNIDVYPGKFYAICATKADCTMGAMTGITPGSSSSVAYPALCTNKNTILFLDIPAYHPSWTGIGSILWCGTDQFNVNTGSPGGEKYDIYSSGAGNITLKVHY